MMKFIITAFHQILFLLFRSKKVRWTGHVEVIGDVNNANRFWLENFKEKSSFAAIFVHGRIVHKFILQKWHCGCGTHLLGSYTPFISM
jgi:hypothetical protein